jgi:hypothetical protein
MNLNLRPISLAVLALLSSLTINASAQEERRTYIVQLADQPAATYNGGVNGLAATQPAPGEVFDFRAPSVQEYIRYLGDRKTEVLASVGNPAVIANYDVVLNGFAVQLTDAEVLALKNNPAVADVQADAVRRVDTISTARFLGLSTNGGLWSKFTGGQLVKGENMVIGVVDSGIWPENPAFADRVDANGNPTFDGSGTLAYLSPPASFKGGCQSGEGFDAGLHCNNKLIGAKYFNAGFLVSSNGPKKNWSEFYSPRDSNIGSNGVSTGHGGHGSHTASTAAGNDGAFATVNGVPMGPSTGMAPRARIAAYKVCWTYDDPAAEDGTNASNTCYNTDSVLAIDEAVKDGVNVINYSISGSQTSVNDPVEQAFYRASLAGVFVAASAGNSGPAQAVAHVSPWLTTVAASTHDRSTQADVTLGSGAKYSGASLNVNPLGSAPLIRAEDAGLGGGAASLCFSDAGAAAALGQVKLDPDKVAGKVVVCTRGENARVDKSLAVLQAGGIGMVMADNGGGLVSEAHSVPTVHVTAADGAAIKTYAQTQAASAAISAFAIKSAPAPIMAGFSSRGPNAGDSNMLKPDLTAPGVDVIASVTAALTPAEHAAVAAGTLVPPAAYASYQGTSMSSPHVAGLGLLMRQLHPDWTPAAIKSALMTTAYSTLNDGLAGAQNGLLPWSQGAGHVDPNKAADPGLVYDLKKPDYVAYQCKVNKAAVQPQSDCTLYGTLDETYNLNLPSITIGGVQNSVTVRRSVTNVGGASATYNATASVPGFSTVVTPSSLTLAPGETAAFTVKLTTTNAANGVWNFGSLSWTDGTHVVRSPIQARTGKSIAGTTQLTGDKTSGTRIFPMKATFNGRMTALKGGLKAPTLGSAVTLTPGPLSSANLKLACAAGNDLPNVKVYNVAIPAGTVAARFALRDADVGSAGDDNDMGVLTPSGAWIYSGNDGSNESAQIAGPDAGNYKVCVTAYGGGASMSHKLQSTVVSTADVGGKFTVVLPGKVVANVAASIVATWSGLANDTSYLGGIQFQDLNGNVQTTTIVNINTGSASIPVAETERTRSKLID